MNFLGVGYHQMRLTFRFAVGGFLIAMVAAICLSSHVPDIVVETALILSPTVYLLIQPTWGRMPIDNWVFAWWLSAAVAAVMNGVFYGMVGAAITSLRRVRKKRGSSTNSSE
jgi:hypothetical protein